MSNDFDDQIGAAQADMKDAADTLLELGFPQEQWHQITKFIAAAIIHSQWAIAKANAEISKEATFQSKVL
jgi:hypothetical protein